MRSAKNSNAKGGRPKTSDPRSRQLKLNLTISEFEEIEKRARAVGVRPAHLARTAIFSLGTPPSAEPDGSRISRLILDQLRRLGNNLNQLVRHLHQTGDPLPPDLEPLLVDIRNLIAKARP